MDAHQEKFECTLQLLEKGDYEAARRNFRQLASETADKENKASYVLGELTALVRLGRTSETRQLLQDSRAIFNEIDWARARADLIELQVDSLEGKWDRVLPELEEMLRTHSTILHQPALRDVYEEVQLRRGMRLASLGRFREALPALKEALDFNPALLTGEFYFELSRCYLDAGDRVNANEAISKALSLGLDDVRAASARWELAVILMRKGDYKQALDELRLAEKHANAARVSKENIYKALAVCLQKLGMEDQARYYARLVGQI